MTTSVTAALADLVAAEELGAVLTVIAGEGLGAKALLDATGSVRAGSLPDSVLLRASEDARQLMSRELSMSLSYHGIEVFHEVVAPPPRLFLFGAVHISQELVQHARLLGFHTLVADPRPAFVTKERFPDADELMVGWPDEVVEPTSLDERTFVVVLTHDRRFEDPLWPLVLPAPVRYIGAMGSSKTTAARRARLIAAGHAPEDVDRIHGPVGLPIGARSAGEVAVAILAEMISARYQPDRPPSLHGVPVPA